MHYRATLSNSIINFPGITEFNLTVNYFEYRTSINMALHRMLLKCEHLITFSDDNFRIICYLILFICYMSINCIGSTLFYIKSTNWKPNLPLVPGDSSSLQESHRTGTPSAKTYKLITISQFPWKRKWSHKRGWTVYKIRPWASQLQSLSILQS